MSLLPPSSTDFEIAVEAAMDEFDIIAPALDTIKGVKYARPLNPTVAPWLVQEYGLGPISPYFGPGGTTALTDGSTFLTTIDGTALLVSTTVEVLIDEGRAWQRIRGTPEAITRALRWITYYNVSIEDQAVGRRRWHLYQINMGELPLPDEGQRLADAEYLAGISDPARSIFSRGYYGYDVRVHVWGRSSYGRSIWGDSSGVTLPPGATKWSYGRQHVVDIQADADDRVVLDINFGNGDDVSWDEEFAWDTPGIAWSGVYDAAAARSWVVTHRDAYFAFYGEGGSVIGYVKIMMPATVVFGAQTIVSYDVRTGFGDGAGSSVQTGSLVYGARTKAGVKPYKRWLLPSEVEFPDGEIRVGEPAFDFSLMKTVREFCTVNFNVST
jgi:hypothetical protein